MLSVVAMATWDRVLCVSLSGRLRQTRSQTHNENSIYVGKHSPICHLCFKRERTALHLQLVESQTGFLEVSLFRIA